MCRYVYVYVFFSFLVSQKNSQVTVYLFKPNLNVGITEGQNYTFPRVDNIRSHDIYLFTFFSFFFLIFGYLDCGNQFPNQGSNPHPLRWKCRVLTTGPPGKYQQFFFFFSFLIEKMTFKIERSILNIYNKQPVT